MDQATKLRIGQQIRAFRKERGLTQAQLGEAVGVTLAQISNIETGHTPPSLDTLINIARTLRVSLPDIIGLDRSGGDASLAERRAQISALASTMGPEELDFLLDLLTVLRKRQRANFASPRGRPRGRRPTSI